MSGISLSAGIVLPVAAFSLVAYFFPDLFNFVIAVVIAWVFAEGIMRFVKGLSHEAQQRFRGSDTLNYGGLVMAILVSSTVGATVGNFMASVNPPSFPFNVIFALWKLVIVVPLFLFYYLIREED
jgi:hypothetical protein